MNKVRSAVGFVLCAALLGACGKIGVEERVILLVDHAKAGMIEQDVFVEKTRGSNQVFRLSAGEADRYADALIFRTVRAVDPAPFSITKTGPYPKGDSLGVTLGDWRGGSGKVYYTCTDGNGRIESYFRNLIPNGTYSMWHLRIARTHWECADCPYSMKELPVGAADGSQSTFVTDVRGRSLFIIEFESCLMPSDDAFVSALGITYHSDGETHGTTPGARGRTAHAQLFGLLEGSGEK